ncbi:hypothetical protein HMPREF9080_02225 [Cardiobacterium valvarum F0432]|uniref:Uncharacterized protein n=1 Tax=Cardiobacterium valvarum F0432 TaxID=797473 RepID=G9ZHB7_9GAMM|nr:hypothetical protein HMPREF9080_02225 [Cardiobacterium valvarum F0432]
MVESAWLLLNCTDTGRTKIRQKKYWQHHDVLHPSAVHLFTTPNPARKPR